MATSREGGHQDDTVPSGKKKKKVEHKNVYESPQCFGQPLKDYRNGKWHRSKTKIPVQHP